MKTCPNCQKEFPDAMRFCQTDGTPLIDTAEQPAEDFLKTMVVRPEELAQSLQESDPFKTVVGGPVDIDDSGDLLQLPEEIDPMKTMIATPIVATPKVEPEPPKPAVFEDIRQDIKPVSPASPFEAFQTPSVPLPEPPAAPDDPTVLQPEPPSFSAPDPAPPSFGNVSGAPEANDDMAATMIQSSFDSAPKVDDSPFSKPVETPESSPFAAPAAPQSPFDAPKSPFDGPFEQPAAPSFDSPFQQPPAVQDPPPVQFGQSFGQPEFGNQPLQSADWTPPAPPEQGWQNQPIGSNTPFQPPVVGEGQNKTLAIVSLVTGILSVVCCFSFITGPIALITGFMARKKANEEPATFGGAGLALAGIVTGAIGTIFGTLAIVLQILGQLAR